MDRRLHGDINHLERRNTLILRRDRVQKARVERRAVHEVARVQRRELVHLRRRRVRQPKGLDPRVELRIRPMCSWYKLNQ